MLLSKNTDLKIIVLFFFLFPRPVEVVLRMMMMVVVLVEVRMEMIRRNVTSALLGDGTHRFAGHRVVVRAADVHLDRR